MSITMPGDVSNETSGCRRRHRWSIRSWSLGISPLPPAVSRERATSAQSWRTSIDPLGSTTTCLAWTSFLRLRPGPCHGIQIRATSICMDCPMGLTPLAKHDDSQGNRHLFLREGSDRSDPIFPARLTGVLADREIHLNGQRHRHRLAITGSRTEAPLFDGALRILIQSIRHRLDKARQGKGSILANETLHDHGPADSCLPRASVYRGCTCRITSGKVEPVPPGGAGQFKSIGRVPS